MGEGESRLERSAVNVIERLDSERAATNVLAHPFYQRWSAGELDAVELGCYAEQYRHAVVALAEASWRAAELSAPAHAPALRAHAQEESSHVELWDRFAAAVGARAGSLEPLPETRECARAWSAGAGLLERLGVLYAIEASQPDISQTKLRGLVDHYGYRPEGPALEYFSVHASRDREHAEQARALIERLLPAAHGRSVAAEGVVLGAHAALKGNWLLLDGVERASVR